MAKHVSTQHIALEPQVLQLSLSKRANVTQTYRHHSSGIRFVGPTSKHTQGRRVKEVLNGLNIPSTCAEFASHDTDLPAATEPHVESLHR